MLDAGPTLNEHWRSVQCLRKSCPVNTHYWGSCFSIPAVIFKVTQLRARAIKELRALVELLTHRCHSSIYGLAMIWKLALNAAVGIKRIS